MKNKILATSLIILILIILIFLINISMDKKINEIEHSVTATINGPNDITILIKKVFLSKPSFIVIQDLDRETRELNSIWAVSDLLPAGKHENISIPLNHEPSQVLFAVLYEDDGDGIFNDKLDMPILNGDGNNVMTQFNLPNTQ